jgi:hypothetical protein
VVYHSPLLLPVVPDGLADLCICLFGMAPVLAVGIAPVVGGPPLVDAGAVGCRLGLLFGMAPVLAVRSSAKVGPPLAEAGAVGGRPRTSFRVGHLSVVLAVGGPPLAEAGAPVAAAAGGVGWASLAL